MDSATPPAGSSPRFDRTAAAILDAAARVFHEHGTGANLAAVATAAGISRATLYRYYANREALLDALTGDALDTAARRLAEADLDQVPVDEAIGRIFRALVAVGDRYAVLLGDHAMLDAAHRRLADAIQSVLARGVETGALRADLPVELLYDFLTGTAVKAIALTQHRRLGAEAASAAATTLFLHGSQHR
jgi:AcrR family transcriptional regulator